MNRGRKIKLCGYSELSVFFPMKGQQKKKKEEEEGGKLFLKAAEQARL